MRDDVQERLTHAFESIAKSLEKIADKPAPAGSGVSQDGHRGQLDNVLILSKRVQRNWTKFKVSDGNEYATKRDRVIAQAVAAIDAKAPCVVHYTITKNRQFLNYWLEAVQLIGEDGKPIETTEEEEFEEPDVF